VPAAPRARKRASRTKAPDDFTLEQSQALDETVEWEKSRKPARDVDQGDVSTRDSNSNSREMKISLARTKSLACERKPGADLATSKNREQFLAQKNSYLCCQKTKWEAREILSQPDEWERATAGEVLRS
jgi:hypothetical protein